MEARIPYREYSATGVGGEAAELALVTRRSVPAASSVSVGLFIGREGATGEDGCASEGALGGFAIGEWVTGLSVAMGTGAEVEGAFVAGESAGAMVTGLFVGDGPDAFGSAPKPDTRKVMVIPGSEISAMVIPVCLTCPP